MSTSASANSSDPCFPTETEIYIRPDGRVIIADLPVELAALVESIGAAEPCEIAPAAQSNNPGFQQPSP